MSDEVPPPPMLDLEAARIRRKKLACPHEAVEVDEVATSLTCSACGVEVDPWCYLRRLAATQQDQLVERQKNVDRYYEWLAKARAQVARVQAEIAELIETKNRLQNEEVMGMRVGAQVKRRSRRST